VKTLHPDGQKTPNLEISCKAGFLDINQHPQAVCSLKGVFLDYSLKVDFLLRPDCSLRGFLWGHFYPVTAISGA
jgi:hypothetical protein